MDVYLGAAAINLVGAYVCTPHINVADLFLIKLENGCKI